MTIFDDNFLMTIFDDIETIFDNWKDSPEDLTFETLITILTIENLNSDNHFYLTVNCDTGQHSQFLRCFVSVYLTPLNILHTGTRILWCGYDHLIVQYINSQHVIARNESPHTVCVTRRVNTYCWGTAD